eukprot:CAMPEP_0170292536 /NCGR_PEP_ID=MMETSP0116_2-20130129/46364_1 /TAXON_ID=400756 /ORGANISM="Durinskia baltica, Strain CSIRO CS-38" /LENGTH=150 /DNA_ID=CAMNT_0010544031 /DNA_START=238 /DNA_END=691 /DNA_ORIENTATION=+
MARGARRLIGGRRKLTSNHMLASRHKIKSRLCGMALRGGIPVPRTQAPFGALGGLPRRGRAANKADGDAEPPRLHGCGENEVTSRRCGQRHDHEHGDAQVALRHRPGSDPDGKAHYSAATQSGEQDAVKRAFAVQAALQVAPELERRNIR